MPYMKLLYRCYTRAVKIATCARNNLYLMAVNVCLQVDASVQQSAETIQIVFIMCASDALYQL